MLSNLSAGRQKEWRGEEMGEEGEEGGGGGELVNRVDPSRFGD